jgi:hypothetical protein
MVLKRLPGTMNVFKVGFLRVMVSGESAALVFVDVLETLYHLEPRVCDTLTSEIFKKACSCLTLKS